MGNLNAPKIAPAFSSHLWLSCHGKREWTSRWRTRHYVNDQRQPQPRVIADPASTFYRPQHQNYKGNNKKSLFFLLWRQFSNWFFLNLISDCRLDTEPRKDQRLVKPKQTSFAIKKNEKPMATRMGEIHPFTGYWFAFSFFFLNFWQTLYVTRIIGYVNEECVLVCCRESTCLRFFFFPERDTYNHLVLHALPLAFRQPKFFSQKYIKVRRRKIVVCVEEAEIKRERKRDSRETGTGAPCSSL